MKRSFGKFAAVVAILVVGSFAVATVADAAAALISAFRQQHGEGSVAISPALTRIAQEQANAMAGRDLLDHDVLAPFSSRMSRSHFNRAAENIAYGHADFASTLKQWTNSTGHRANLLLHGAKWVGVAHAQNVAERIGQ